MIIQLTRTNAAPLYVNASSISHFSAHSVEPAKAQIKMLTGDMFFVEENPEEISQMLRGAYKTYGR